MESLAHLVPLLEALLFVSERALTADELASFIPDASRESVDHALKELARLHATGGGGLQVEAVAGGYRLSTRADLGETIKEFFQLKNRHKLSRAALETLAIVAYKQPVTNPEIQEIRGVSAEGVVRTLLERRMVRIVGRKDTVGKPLLYGTTRAFLEHFGLASLEDLPPVEEFGELLGEDTDFDEPAVETAVMAPGAPAEEAATDLAKAPRPESP